MSLNSRSQQQRYEAMLQLLRSSDTLWNASHALFERWDLSPSQFNVMNLLHNNSEGLSQSDLSRQLVVHRSNITGLVDRLEKRNLVKRAAVPGDRRLYNVALTQQGSTIMEEILPLYHESAVRLWEGVTDDRIQALLSDLESLIQQSQTIARELSESSATAQRKGK